MSGKRNNMASRNAGRSIAMVENLESRRMMSVTSIGVSNGVITVVANGDQDVIHVVAKTVYTTYRGVAGFFPVVDVTSHTTSDVTTITNRFFKAGVTGISISSGDGEDHINCADAGLPCTLNGGDGTDMIEGSALADRILPGLRSDTVQANGGDDVIIDEDSSEDYIYGGDGHDRVISPLAETAERAQNFLTSVEEVSVL